MGQKKVYNLLFFKPRTWFFGDGHYHKKKTDDFYTISGRCKALLKEVEAHEC